ncbi:hypothetical protein ACET3Z_009638 [Daucus carota]
MPACLPTIRRRSLSVAAIQQSRAYLGTVFISETGPIKSLGDGCSSLPHPCFNSIPLIFTIFCQFFLGNLLDAQ